MSSLPTIKDVALLAGVSIGTVDRVVHNRGKVSERNMKAVQSAIDALGYRPSRIASALVKRRNDLKIGVCVPTVETEFWNNAIEGVRHAEEKLAPFGVSLVVETTSTYDFQDQKNCLLRLLAAGVNALILVPVQGKESQLDELIPPEIPYATVIEDIPDSRRLFHVGPDDYAMGFLAGRLATLYVQPAMRCVILAANQQFWGTQDRIRGFQTFLQQNVPGAAVLDTCEIPSATERIAYQSIYEIAVQQMKVHPDLNAFYVTNGLTQWAAAAVKNNKRDGSILVFGYEHTEMTDTFLREGVIGATICQGPAQQWYNAIHIMYQYLDGQRAIETPVFNAECRILIRESLPLVHLEGFPEL